MRVDVPKCLQTKSKVVAYSQIDQEYDSDPQSNISKPSRISKFDSETVFDEQILSFHDFVKFIRRRCGFEVEQNPPSGNTFWLTPTWRDTQNGGNASCDGVGERSSFRHPLSHECTDVKQTQQENHHILHGAPTRLFLACCGAQRSLDQVSEGRRELVYTPQLESNPTWVTQRWRSLEVLHNNGDFLRHARRV